MTAVKLEKLTRNKGFLDSSGLNANKLLLNVLVKLMDWKFNITFPNILLKEKYFKIVWNYKYWYYGSFYKDFIKIKFNSTHFDIL